MKHMRIRCHFLADLHVSRHARKTEPEYPKKNLVELTSYKPKSCRLRQLRDDSRSDAMVVLKDVLPLSTKFVTSVNNFFDWYEGLEFQQWRNKIPWTVLRDGWLQTTQ